MDEDNPVQMEVDESIPQLKAHPASRSMFSTEELSELWALIVLELKLGSPRLTDPRTVKFWGTMKKKYSELWRSDATYAKKFKRVANSANIKDEYLPASDRKYVLEKLAKLPPLAPLRTHSSTKRKASPSLMDIEKALYGGSIEQDETVPVLHPPIEIDDKTSDENENEKPLESSSSSLEIIEVKLAEPKQDKTSPVDDDNDEEEEEEEISIPENTGNEVFDALFIRNPDLVRSWMKINAKVDRELKAMFEEHGINADLYCIEGKQLPQL